MFSGREQSSLQPSLKQVEQKRLRRPILKRDGFRFAAWPGDAGPAIGTLLARTSLQIAALGEPSRTLP
jgi:hypothetical protein